MVTKKQKRNIFEWFIVSFLLLISPQMALNYLLIKLRDTIPFKISHPVQCLTYVCNELRLDTSCTPKYFRENPRGSLKTLRFFWYLLCPHWSIFQSTVRLEKSSTLQLRQLFPSKMAILWFLSTLQWLK